MFYNSEQKLRYKETLPEASAEVFSQILSTASKVEFQEGTDLSNFNRLQVTNLLKTYNSRSRLYLGLICKHYSNYYQWCLSERLVDVTNVTDWYDVKLSKSIVAEVLPNELIEDKFFDEEKMKEYVAAVKDPSNKLLLYAPFMGIDGEEHCDLTHLRLSDLDEENHKIKLYSGITVSVDDLFIELLKNADKSDRYDEEGTGQYKRSDRTLYGESIYAIKPCGVNKKDEILSSKRISGRYAVIKEQAGNKFLTTSLIYKNGLINYISKYYNELGITIENALFKMDADVKRLKKYDEKTQELIYEFGSKMAVKMLRLQMKEVIHYYN